MRQQWQTCIASRWLSGDQVCSGRSQLDVKCVLVTTNPVCLRRLAICTACVELDFEARLTSIDSELIKSLDITV